MKHTNERTMIFIAVAAILAVSFALQPSTAQDTGSADKEKLNKSFPSKPAFSP